MLILISPSKTQDFETPAPLSSAEPPALLEQSMLLVEQLRKLSVSEIASLMSVSEKIAKLNFDRFHAWGLPFTPDNARPAAYAFKGDVYTGLDAVSLRPEDTQYADAHLRILSGLYGVLRPFSDLIQPYRLEMGIRLSNPRGKDLYEFWGDLITERLNQDLEQHAASYVINLASNEYFSAVKPKRLAGPVISPVFKDRAKSGELKIISIFAKRARGLMARWIIQNRVESPENIKSFDVDGYRFNAADSTEGAPVFVR